MKRELIFLWESEQPNAELYIQADTYFTYIIQTLSLYNSDVARYELEGEHLYKNLIKNTFRSWKT